MKPDEEVESDRGEEESVYEEADCGLDGPPMACSDRLLRVAEDNRALAPAPPAAPLLAEEGNEDLAQSEDSAGHTRRRAGNEEDSEGHSGKMEAGSEARMSTLLLVVEADNLSPARTSSQAARTMASARHIAALPGVAVLARTSPSHQAAGLDSRTD